MRLLFDSQPGEDLPPFDSKTAEPIRAGHASLVFALGEQLVLKTFKPDATALLALEGLYYFDAKDTEHQISPAEFTARLVELLNRYLGIILPSRVAICQLLGDAMPGIIQTRYRVLEEEDQAVPPPFGFVTDNAFLVVSRHDPLDPERDLAPEQPQYLFLDWDRSIAKAARFFQDQLNADLTPELAYLAIEKEIQNWAAKYLAAAVGRGEEAAAKSLKAFLSR